MLAYLIAGTLFLFLVFYFLNKFFHLPHKIFKKYTKIFFIIIIFSLILFLIRINPNFLSILPGLVIFFIRWKPVIDFVRKYFSSSYRKKNNNNMMSRKEALKILGLPDDATKKEILDSYHSLIKKNHPDLGGSDWITSQINKAKETLLG